MGWNEGEGVGVRVRRGERLTHQSPLLELLLEVSYLHL
jgi:hypothetical protein